MVAREPIFDVFERTDSSPGRQGESTFAFLNRVLGSYWEHPRRLVQAWAERISDEVEYRDLRSRLRSRENDQFRSAFLELYLHECLLRAGYQVTVHPDVPGTTRHPDFYCERNGSGFYLEAISPSSSQAAKSAARRRADLLDIVNRVESPNFFLRVVKLYEGSNPPRASRLRRGLESWLAGLNPDDEFDFENSPELRWEDNGWAATFAVIPKSSNARHAGASGRAIGMYPVVSSWVDDAPTIRAALSEKHSAYPGLGSPFVIAVGTYIVDSDRWHSTNALYGREAIALTESVDGDLVFDSFVRQPDGYFGMAPEWNHNNVSAVLLVNQLTPWHVLKAETTLWRHPAPLRLLPSDIGLPWDSIEVNGAQLVERPAPLTAAALLGLPEAWLPGQPWQ
ncbi:hypothetical protein [Nocardia sp. CDC160]|uniref:hypothetical protein n=1 Tax=Nocardia sp. CDC160 TaxID=3112166 RepID=UPI002DBA51F9|nr:hypothetical protein [Nocardia sp. CDC160]MEC3916358.1 hypothetical protein [Nocardia sp. CDC160]